MFLWSRLTLWFPPAAWSPGCPRYGRRSPCCWWRPGVGGRDPCGWCWSGGSGSGLYTQCWSPAPHTHPAAWAWSHSSSGPDGCGSEKESSDFIHIYSEKWAFAQNDIPIFKSCFLCPSQQISIKLAFACFDKISQYIFIFIYFLCTQTCAFLSVWWPKFRHFSCPEAYIAILTTKWEHRGLSLSCQTVSDDAQSKTKDAASESDSEVSDETFEARIGCHSQAPFQKPWVDKRPPGIWNTSNLSIKPTSP